MKMMGMPTGTAVLAAAAAAVAMMVVGGAPGPAGSARLPRGTKHARPPQPEQQDEPEQ